MVVSLRLLKFLCNQVNIDEISDRFPGLVELLLSELAPSCDVATADVPRGKAETVKAPRVLVSAAVLPVLTMLARLQQGQPGSNLQAGFHILLVRPFDDQRGKLSYLLFCVSELMVYSSLMPELCTKMAFGKIRSFT